MPAGAAGVHAAARLRSPLGSLLTRIGDGLWHERLGIPTKEE
jgi:hypothetical protein